MKHKLLVTLGLSSLMLTANAASLLGVCTANKSLDQCPKAKLFFPTYNRTGDTFDFKFRVDIGDIGDIDEATASSSTIDILELWEAESSLDFINEGSLSQDITGNNFNSVLSTNSPLGYSPIVFDDDGTITDALFGTGAKQGVLGFAGATFFNTSGTSITGIKEAQAVFNGFLFSQAGGGGSMAAILVEFKTTILHEFGHMFGLDHSQGGNLEGFNNRDSDQTDIPVMFPFAANPLVELQHDDIASVRAAYPVGDEASKFGSITGTLVDDGNVVEGANVVAYLIDDSNPRKRAVASPSDILGAGDGAFTLPNLIPGTYIIKAEPIDSDFTDGSSLGIYNPIPSSQMTTGFYNGDGNNIVATNNLNTGISQAEQITVTAGSSTSIVFDIGDNPTGGDNGGDNGDNDNSDGGDNGGSDTNTETFTLGGAAVNKAIFLKSFKPRNVKIKIINTEPGTLRNIKVSTDYPDLIQFPKGDTVSFTKRGKKVKMTLSSFADFSAVIPELIDDSGDGTAEIPITVEDLDTGYIDDSQTLIVF